MTATDAISVALQLLGAIDVAETPSASEMADGLVRLTDMLANWALEGMNLTGIVISVYPLVSGTITYTMGSGGSLDAVNRPLKITAAVALQPAAGGGNIRTPLKLLTEQEWAEIPFRDSLTASNPSGMLFNPTFPLATVNFSPVPTFSSGARTVELHFWSALANFADLTTAVTFPPGYERAIRYNLAIELAAEYAATASPEVISIAKSSKAAIRALNVSPPGVAPPAGPVDALPNG